ncbi:MAG TPA: hypothetical protein PK566_02470 [Pseudobacteroides sp.]|nr:hypothetical protein [Pseudobacteroides sp.]
MEEIYNRNNCINYNSRNSRKYIIYAIISGIIILITALLVIGIIGLIKGPNEINLAESGIYQGRFSNNPYVWGGLFVFPDKLSASATVEEYFAFETVSIDNSYQIFLKYKLPNDDFLKEIERLKNISCEIKDYNRGNVRSVTKNIKYDETNFNYPAYVASFASHDTYEYALIDNANKTIICVYLQMISKSKSRFNSDYLPHFLTKQDGEYWDLGSSLETDQEKQNIYWHTFDDGKTFTNFKDYQDKQ